MIANQLRLNDFRNLGEIFILEHSLNIFLALKKFRSLEFFCLIIIIL